nr:uncharacterized protein LOC110202998 isoform X2 [Phascolarctos cinereus]
MAAQDCGGKGIWGEKRELICRSLWWGSGGWKGLRERKDRKENGYGDWRWRAGREGLEAGLQWKMGAEVRDGEQGTGRRRLAGVRPDQLKFCSALAPQRGRRGYYIGSLSDHNSIGGGRCTHRGAGGGARRACAAPAATCPATPSSWPSVAVGRALYHCASLGGARRSVAFPTSVWLGPTGRPSICFSVPSLSGLRGLVTQVGGVGSLWRLPPPSPEKWFWPEGRRAETNAPRVPGTVHRGLPPAQGRKATPHGAPIGCICRG